MSNNNLVDDLKLVAIHTSGAYSSINDPENDSEKKSRYRKSAQELENLVQKLPVDFQKPGFYHVALLYAIAEDKVQSNNILNKITADSIALPEAYWLLIQMDESSNPDFRIRTEGILGKMLPLSIWGKMADGKLEVDEANKLEASLIRGADWPSIPEIDSKKILRIAVLFDEMGLAKDAANAYREAIYSLNPPRLPVFGEDSWISENTSSYWLSIARNELLLGKQAWAFQAILMAVISSPKALQSALDIISQMEFPQEKEIKAKPDPDKFNQIASLYIECNLHPRAIETLILAEQLLKADYKERKASVLNRWRKLIDEFIQGRENLCFLFGNKIVSTPIEELLPKKFPYGHY